MYNMESFITSDGIKYEVVVCSVCGKEFYELAPGKIITCYDCKKKEKRKSDIKNIQKEAGCDLKMAKYLYKIKERLPEPIVHSFSDEIIKLPNGMIIF